MGWFKFIVLVVVGGVVFSPFSMADEKPVIFGGPEGGTFNRLALGMAEVLSDNAPGKAFSSQLSRGSVDNIRKVSSGAADFAVCYASDFFLAWNGILPGDNTRYSGMRKLGEFHRRTVHLAVLHSSGIDHITQLAGKSIVLGTPGSGSADSAGRLLKLIGVWSRIDKQYLRLNEGIEALKASTADAIWFLGRYPDQSLAGLAERREINLLDIYPSAAEKGVALRMPFYQPDRIPGGVYRGIDRPVNTLSDNALWIVNAEVDEDLVYEVLTIVYGEKGLEVFHDLDLPLSVQSVANHINKNYSFLHKGAEAFWKEQGALLHMIPNRYD